MFEAICELLQAQEALAGHASLFNMRSVLMGDGHTLLAVTWSHALTDGACWLRLTALVANKPFVQKCSISLQASENCIISFICTVHYLNAHVLASRDNASDQLIVDHVCDMALHAASSTD